MDTSPKLTPDRIVYDLVSAGEPQLSPDGSTIVYSRAQAERGRLKPSSHLWLIDRDGGNPRQLTTAGTRNGVARWSPDGAWVAYVSDADGDSGLYVTSPAGDTHLLISKHRPGVGEIAWSPDGRHIAYVAAYDPDNPSEAKPADDAPPPVRVVRRVDYKQENRGFLNDVRQQVWVVEAATGERRRLTAELLDHGVPTWSPDGTRLAVKISTRNGMTSQLALIDVASGESSRVGFSSGQVTTWAWSPDGRSILFSGDPDSTWQTDWFLLDVDRDEVRRLTDDLECLPDGGFPTVALPAQPVWLDANAALFSAFHRGASALYRLQVSSGALEKLVQLDGQHGGLSTDADHRYVVQSRSAPDGAGEAAVIDAATGEVTVVTTHNAALFAEAPLGRTEAFEIERGGLTFGGWLLYPPDFDATKRAQYPLVLDIHGGPNAHHGPGFNANQQAMAQAGMVVLFINPRGSSSYGRDFTMRVGHDWAGEDLLDQYAALDAVVARGFVDPDRLGVYGYSYGGYMTSWIIGSTHRFKAAVIGAPVVDLTSFYGTSDIGHTFGPRQIGGKPWESPEEYRKRSPLTMLHTARTPTLIVHGEADDRCPIGQGEQCFMALMEAGCEVEFARYPGEAHAMLRTGLPAHRLDYLERVSAWFVRHLGGPA